MNVPFSIAKRYLFSPKNRSAINIISAIAALGVLIGSLAMIIVLSAFNGLETLVADLYTSVDPDIRISPAKGKTFDLDSAQYAEIAQWPEIAATSPTLEETVFLQFEDQQTIVSIRGINPSYLPNLGLDTHLIEGSFALEYEGIPGAILGYGVADNLNLFVRDATERIKVFAAKRDGIKSLNPESKFKTMAIPAYGIVQLNPEFDYKYLYVPFAFAEELLQYEHQASFIDITLANDKDKEQVKAKLEAALGDKFEVKTRVELNDLLFKTNATEKWVTFFILSFILIVATFNLIGSLTMLIIEKKSDISLLRSIGTTVTDIRKVFLYEGLLITAVGAIVGLGIGVTLVLLQQYVGFFPLEGGLVEYYPMRFSITDLAAVIAVVFVIGLTASFIPVRVLLQQKKLI
ncbi:MAG: ABC transporter permease [Salibacteraceae bacterium]|nr:ABC transporter permease [Salibacteraceae bacterium]MDP4934079.1 ABC transporter permease [Salibacteraceae bacterium]MDP4965980.1 ABC transporter permease [Salibacteraceae bacterium]